MKEGETGETQHVWVGEICLQGFGQKIERKETTLEDNIKMNLTETM
jgi:hypothetical protein